MIEPYRHNSWATLRLLEFCSDLDPSILDASAPGTFGAISDTLAHLIRTEEGLLATVEGTPPPSGSYGFTGVDDLLERARRLSERWDRCLEPEPHPERLVERVWRGQKRPVRAGAVPAQVVQHGNEPRAPVCTVPGPTAMRAPPT